jgi:hypothetical protein
MRFFAYLGELTSELDLDFFEFGPDRDKYFL